MVLALHVKVVDEQHSVVQSYDAAEQVTSTSTSGFGSDFDQTSLDFNAQRAPCTTTSITPLPGFHNFGAPMKIYSQPADSPDGVHAWVHEDFIEPRYGSHSVESKSQLDPFDFIKDLPTPSSLAELKPLDPLEYLNASPDTSASSLRHETSPSSSSPNNQYKGAITNSNTFLGYNGTPEPVSTTTSPTSSTSIIAVKQEQHYNTGIPQDLDDLACIINNAMNDNNLSNNFNDMTLPDTLHSLHNDLDIEEWIENMSTTQNVKHEPRDTMINSTMSPPHLSPTLVSTQLPHSSTTITSLQNSDYTTILSSHQQNHHTSSPMLQSLLAAGTVTNNNYLTGLMSEATVHKQDMSMPILQARLTQGLKDVGSSMGIQGTILKSDPMFARASQYYIQKDNLPHSTDLTSYTTVSTTDDLLTGKYDVRAFLDKTQLASPESTDYCDSKAKNRNRIRTKLPIRTEGTKDKPIHQCTVCGRGFLNKSNIKVHLRTHTGEKPFKCETCNKAFRQKAHLIKHYQIHRRGNRE